MAGLSQLLSFAPPTPEQPDPVAEAVKAFQAGKATPEQKKIVGALPASAINQTSAPTVSAQQELGAAGNVGVKPGATSKPQVVFDASKTERGGADFGATAPTFPAAPSSCCAEAFGEEV